MVALPGLLDLTVPHRQSVLPPRELIPPSNTQCAPTFVAAFAERDRREVGSPSCHQLLDPYKADLADSTVVLLFNVADFS